MANSKSTITLPLIKILLTIYDLAWRAITPFLKRSPRIGLGWKQRTLQEYSPGPYDIWIQAASGGESMLTNMIIDRLPALIATKGLKQSSNKLKSINILATSGTQQGVDTLRKGVQNRRKKGEIPGRVDVEVAYFPLDAPHIMKQAFQLYNPRLAVIVETELWPGFLDKAKELDIPVLLVNGRISDKSFRSYQYLSFLFNPLAPKVIYAISQLDKKRFAGFMQQSKIEVVENIKFDKIEPKEIGPFETPLQSLLPESRPFVVLGSIRREEETKIISTIERLLVQHSDILIGLFPKHIERADHWLELLAAKEIDGIKRSAIDGETRNIRVIVWDVFGELAGAYSLAKAAFIGGSLVNLGGQNFLEPLVFGLRPIIGPNWTNFAWVGRDIITSGLVVEVQDEEELADALLKSLEKSKEKDEVLQQVQEFFNPKKGGTELIGTRIIEQLQAIENQTI